MNIQIKNEYNMKKYNLLKFTPLIAAIFLMSCGGSDQSTSDSESLQKARVRVQEVQLVSVNQTSTFTASVEADKVNNIAPAIGGRIRDIRVDVGSYVKQGQALVTMDQANLTQQQTQVATLKRDYERYSELYEVGGISKQQLDQAKTQLDVAETALSNLGENTTLISPVSGVVTARNYDPGDIAMQLPILTIQSINPVKVKINISESYYSRVTTGMQVEIQADAIGDEVFKGTVSLIHPTLDPISHTFVVEVTVPNSDQRLRPGMFARVKMNFGTNDRPLLSDIAVLKQTGSNDRYVFLEDNGTAIYTLVELGARIDDKYEILSGLNEGDRVIVQGNTDLINGDQVEVIE